MESTTQKQIRQIMKFLQTFEINTDEKLEAQLHIEYTQFILFKFGQYVQHFHTSQPWLIYYCSHIFNLLKRPIQEETKQKITKALMYCFNDGFGGGFAQKPHLGTTYAAFLAILQVGPVAYHLLDRKKLYEFFKSLKRDFKFRMHELGQCDLRAIYIVTLITKSLKLPEDILQGIAETIVKSQSQEGGISNISGGEAHGGFTYCGVAALSLLGRLQDLDVSRLMQWLAARQVQLGGFNGRTNKLFDSCYSFWVGAVFNIVNDYFSGKMTYNGNLLYNQKKLQEYVLFYCQDTVEGGLWDKPSKKRDIYHTNYALSGFAASKQQQYKQLLNNSEIVLINPIYNVSKPAYQQFTNWSSNLQELIIQ